MKSYRAKEAYQERSAAERYEAKRFSGWLGRLVGHWEKRTALDMLTQLPFRNGRVLDLPCGTGRISNMLAGKAVDVVAADISRNMVDVAKKTYRLSTRAEFVVCDAEDLPFRDSQFDCIVSLRLMGHVPPETRRRILEEMRRVTDKWIIVFYYNPNSLMGIFRRAKNKLKGKREEWNPITPRDLRMELKAADLELIKVRPILWGIAETYAALAAKL